MPLPSQPATVERPSDAPRHSVPASDPSLGGASPGTPDKSVDPLGGYDAASDFAPEGGPSVPFREYVAPDPVPGAGPAPEPASDPGSDGFAYNPDGTPKYNADGSRTKKRGRRAGTSQGPRKAPPLRVSSIEALLLSTHGMLAAMTQFEDLALEEKEAKDLAGGIAAVAEHYPLVQMSDKDRAWLGLLAIAGSIYGPRAFLAFKQGQKARAERSRNVSPAPVKPDRPAPGAPGVRVAAGAFPAFVPDA